MEEYLNPAPKETFAEEPATTERVNTERQLPAVESDVAGLSAPTPAERGERRPLAEPGSIAIDNVSLNNIINSIIPPNQHQFIQNASSVPSSTQQYLLPVDLLVSFDGKTNQSTVQAALPSSFTLPSLSQITPFPSHPLNLCPLTSFPQSLLSSQMAPTPAPSQPISVGIPSIPMMATMNTPKSSLNPSAASFTPYTPCTPIAPIIEMEQNSEEFEEMEELEMGRLEIGKSQETDGDTAVKPNSVRQSKPPSPLTPWLKLDPETCDDEWSDLDPEDDEGLFPIPTGKRKPITRKLSPAFPKSTIHSRHATFRNAVAPRRERFYHDFSNDHRDYGKNWRSSKPKIVPSMSPRTEKPVYRSFNRSVPGGSPRFKGSRKEFKPRMQSLPRSPRTPIKVMPHSTQKDSRLLVEFVRHVTLGNRQEYSPNKLLTKTWALRNVGSVEWGNNVELVYCKGDRALTLHERYPVMNAQPGEEVEVSVSLKTSMTPGRMCAYFRLEKNGRFFGPRVWADVIVAGDFKDQTRQAVCRVDNKLMQNKIKWKKVVSVK